MRHFFFSVSIFTLVLDADFINRKVNEMTDLRVLIVAQPVASSFKLKFRMIKAMWPLGEESL